MADRIRLAGPQDGEQIVEIYGPLVRDTAVSFELTVPTAQEMSERITETMVVAPWLVIESKGSVLAYAYSQRHRVRSAYQWSVESSVFVRAGERGRGHGRVLYESLMRLLALQGFERVLAGMTLPNEASAALHRSAGFSPAGTFRRVGYKNSGWHDVQWWQRDLRADAGEAATTPPGPPVRLEMLFAAGVGGYGVSAEEFEVLLREWRFH